MSSALQANGPLPAAPFFSRRWIVISGILLMALLNSTLGYINWFVATPLFYDSIGTAIVAAVFGIVPGIITALITHGLMEVFNSFSGDFYPFVVCNLATAVLVGSMVSRRRLRRLHHAILAVLLVTIANAVLGTIVATYLFAGVTGHASDYLVNGFLIAGQSMIQASFWARIPANLVDKTIAVLPAYMLLRYFCRKRLVAGRC
jgi:energy-coupling factor transport system substrate-specific component